MKMILETQMFAGFGAYALTVGITKLEIMVISQVNIEEQHMKNVK